MCLFWVKYKHKVSSYLYAQLKLEFLQLNRDSTIINEIELTFINETELRLLSIQLRLLSIKLSFIFNETDLTILIDDVKQVRVCRASDDAGSGRVVFSGSLEEGDRGLRKFGRAFVAALNRRLDAGTSDRSFHSVLN